MPDGSAVVLGGSMAGLLTARVLSEFYGQVTVVERDELPDGSAQRRGVPQGRHLHALLARGGEVLDELFPGLTADLIGAGAPSGDLLGGIRWLLSGHRIRQVDIGQPVLFPSRPLLEGQVRARVRALPGVRLADGRDIVDLTASTDRTTITGVTVRDGAGRTTTIRADLVVDATGRGSRTPLWLEGLGFARPTADRVHTDVGYASRTYDMPDDALGTDRLILVNWTREHPRGAGIARQEDGRYMVTLVGLLGDYPPTDPDGFVDFAAGVPLTDVHRLINEGKPLDDPVAFRYPANIRHRYEHLTGFPEGLLVLGDAVCSFNPVYGQGMTVAALQAAALRRHLLGNPSPSWRRYFREIARVVDVPWQLATGADLAFPEVLGHRSLKTRLVNAYLPHLHAAAVTDASLSAAFVRVTGLLDRPEGLLRPDRLLRVLRAALSR
ncbi:FAD-binding monooxygenase [Longispora fulva]|uniref:2-polyprenyl-6-methoxyphenol hydroxylase-like FAD-dependent oxidoreductase n=1 Tax=Longispora fulva TaxID=619741 RepID=A0A8J7KY10_9ACTN|nr:FAD-binding monooxygenase [Longispora fulva]MBG6138602.1 2-polyprenyl-6-methoxyphenol hydroxylase-like FAD-dependent oxidoreductase [Longispora fulva]GIG62291.1 FAD-binding monooxygenase [Longispora fulva]